MSDGIDRRKFIAAGATLLALGDLPSVASAKAKPAESSFSGKVVLITGGTAGIGKAAALAFARLGAKICFCARHPEAGPKVEQEIKAAGGEGYFVKADIASEEEIKNLVAKCVERFGRVDVAFNNVGTGTTVEGFSTEEWNRVMTVNGAGTYFSMKYEIAQMLKQGGGVIINNASLFADRAVPKMAAYSASKFAIIGMTKSLAVEYASRNIRINVISPGMVESDSFEALIKGLRQTPKDLKKGIGIARFATAAEIADAVVWMASPQNSYMCGANIKIDGGYLLGV